MITLPTVNFLDIPRQLQALQNLPNDILRRIITQNGPAMPYTNPMMQYLYLESIRQEQAKVR